MLRKVFLLLNLIEFSLTAFKPHRFSHLNNIWGCHSFLKANFKRFLICASLISVNLTASPVSAANAAKPVILVYGDSLSAAYGIAQEQGWVALLQQRLKQQKLNYAVINASISGETTSGGLSRLEKTLKEHQPKLILIELGANDGLRGLPINEMRKNLEAMITTTQKYKAKVILLGMKIPPNYGLKYTRDFKEVYETLAKQYKLPLVPFLLDGVAGKHELNQDDGLHPLAVAEPAVLNNVWDVVEDTIK